MEFEVYWKKALWDKLSDEEIRKLLESLPPKLQAQIFESFNFSSLKLREIGWKQICLGCGEPYGVCDCPAGSGWVPQEGPLKIKAV